MLTFALCSVDDNFSHIRGIYGILWILRCSLCGVRVELDLISCRDATLRYLLMMTSYGNLFYLAMCKVLLNSVLNYTCFKFVKGR